MTIVEEYKNASYKEIKPTFVPKEEVISLTNAQDAYLTQRIIAVNDALAKEKAYSATNVDGMMSILET